MIYTLIQESAQEGTEVLTDGEPVEKTLSILELISSGDFTALYSAAVTSENIFTFLATHTFLYYCSGRGDCGWREYFDHFANNVSRSCRGVG